MNSHLRKLLVLAIASTAYGSATQADSILLEEVLVTAQKKSAAEDVQGVPISIAAYSGEQVEAMFAVNLTDIGLNTPNVSLSEIPTFPGVANFVIRGMGTVGQSIPSADPAVGVVMDGVALGTIYGVVTDVFDLASVEVLRGPQGTLFGRNVTGGAVIMHSTRPTEEFQGKVRATMGNYNQVGVSALISGPINDNWGAKLAVLSKDRDGYWDNESVGGEQGESESLLIRPALTYNTDNFSAALVAESGSMEGDGLGSLTWWVDGGAAGGGFEIDPYDDRVTYQGDKGENDLDWVQVSLQTDWDLWGGTLTAVLGYRDLEQEMVADIDGWTDARFHFANGTFLDQDQQSLEIRWSGDISEKTTLTTGVYFFDQEYTYGERRILLNAVDRRGVSDVEHGTQGVFAQADYRITDTITLTAGGRYTSEDKDASIGLIGDPNATGGCATAAPPEPMNQAVRMGDCQAAFEDDESWSNFTPKVGINWAFTEDMMAYASYTRGFRSGGYNVRFTDLSFVTENPQSSPGPYDEEVVDAYEIGLKTEFWDGNARVNGAIFYNKYDDLQRTALNDAGGQEILNAASAVISGVEIDAVIAATDNLTLQAGFGYTDAEYDEFEAAENATGMDPKDLRFVMAPEYTYNLAAIYDMDISDTMSLRWRASYSYVDETFSDDFNTAENKDYELVDASATLTTDFGLQVAIFGKNIFDEVYYDFGTNFSTSSLAIQSYWLTPPRTYGIEFTYEF